MYDSEKPLILQSDQSVLLEVDHPAFEEARDHLARFAELESSPEHVHTYRITHLSLWNAAASNMGADEILEGLERFSKFEIPENVRFEIRDVIGRYGRLKLVAPDPGGDLRLEAATPQLLTEVRSLKTVAPFLGSPVGSTSVRVPREARGLLKQALLKADFPVEDLAGHVHGEPLSVDLRSATKAGGALALRPYQERAVDAFWASGGLGGGAGVVVLPCGAGKTLVGIAVMARAGARTLILCTSTVAVRQWIREILDKTTLTEDEIGEYSGDRKEIRPVTVATYHILIAKKKGAFPHFALFGAEDWGLIIYDEVHLLPAPVFRMAAEIQGRRRLGLTATLVREDGLEGDVFSLIGPKKYDQPWKDLERQGWIASAFCTEVRIPLPVSTREAYALGDAREQMALASTNPAKLPVVEEIVRRHLGDGDRILVMGRLLGQLEELATRLGAPLLTGQTPQSRRQELYRGFQSGEVRVLVVSNVANFAVDLPDASVAVEVSGTFGSRQEEAQRLGRILRPKQDGRPAHFYALVSQDTIEHQFAVRRQRFLTEQGYRYTILRDEEITGVQGGGKVVSLEERRRRMAGEAPS